MEELERLSENDEFRVLYDAEKMRRKEINSARLDGYDDGAKEKGIEIAKKFLKNGVSPDIVSESTGLNEDEINNLLDELNS